MRVLPSHIEEFLSGIDIAPSRVGTRLGAGFQHAVYDLRQSAAEAAQDVLKLPHLGMTREAVRKAFYRLITPTPVQAEEEAAMAREYFGAYALPTDVLRSDDREFNDLYAIVQPRLPSFETLRRFHLEAHPELDDQLEEICDANRRLHADHRLYVDLMGVRLTLLPYLDNVVVLDDPVHEGGKRLTLPDVSFFSAPGRSVPDAPIKSLYQKALLPIHRINMSRFGHDFVGAEGES